MKRISMSLGRIKQGLKNLYKNKLFTLASIGTVAACLFLFGIFYFVLSNFKNMVKEAETTVGVTVFFKEDISNEQIKELEKEIGARTEVDHMEYISAKEAWEKFKEENFKGEKDLVDSFGTENPLENSASFSIYLKNIEKQSEFVKYLEGLSGIRSVKRSDEISGMFEHVNRIISIGSTFLISILLLVAIFLIHTTIATGITVRKQEISIMRLLGASDYFIWSPFIVEGMVIGAIGAGIPLVILAIFYSKMITYIASNFGMFGNSLVFLSSGSIFSVLVPVSLLIGIGIGFFGSFITVRRNLNV